MSLFALVTPAHVHHSQVGRFVILVTAVLFGLKVPVVYADAAYSTYLCWSCLKMRAGRSKVGVQPVDILNL